MMRVGLRRNTLEVAWGNGVNELEEAAPDGSFRG